MQRVGRFEAEQAAADHEAGGAARCGGPRADLFEIVERAVHEATVEVVARYRRDERVRTRRDHEFVVGDERSVVEDRLAGHVVDLLDEPPEPVVDSIAGQELVAHEAEILLGLAVEPARQRDTVVRRTALLADHRDRTRRFGVGRDELVDEALTDHAVADHENLASVHATTRPDARYPMIPPT